MRSLLHQDNRTAVANVFVYFAVAIVVVIVKNFFVYAAIAVVVTTVAEFEEHVITVFFDTLGSVVHLDNGVGKPNGYIGVVIVVKVLAGRVGEVSLDDFSGGFWSSLDSFSGGGHVVKERLEAVAHFAKHGKVHHHA